MGYLIDVIGASASVAYGLRKLRGAHSGAGVRVRRASDNLEQDLGFDSSGLLDWSNAIAFKSASQIFAKTWYDQSGNGKDLIQTSASLQPELNTTTQKLSFNGANEFSVALDLSATIKISLFTLVESGSAPTFYIYFEHLAAGNDVTFYSNISNWYIQSINGGVPNSDLGTGYANSAEHLLSAVIDRTLTDGNVVKGYVGGVPIADSSIGSHGGNFGNGTLWIGSRAGSLLLTGSERELVIFPIALTTTQRTNGEANIASYTPIAPPDITTVSPLPNGSEGESYSQTLSATGGTGAPIIWTVQSGTLPPGLSLNSSTGALTGTTTTIGLYSFTIKATDSGTGASDTQGFTLTVTAYAGPPRFPTPNITGILWEHFELLPSDYSTITISHTYEDEGRSFNETTITPAKRWDVTFTGITFDEMMIFETFANAMRLTQTFTFRDKWGVTHSGVRVESYERSHARNISWSYNVHFVLCKYP